MIEDRVEQIEQQVEAITSVLEKVLERVDQLDKLMFAITAQKDRPTGERKTRYLSDEEAREMFCTPNEE